MEMFDGAIRHQQAIFMFKILPILRRTFDCLFHERRVFRMKTLTLLTQRLATAFAVLNPC